MEQNVKHESIYIFLTNNFSPFSGDGTLQHMVHSAGDKTVQK